jgi:hypothetical protein
LHVPRHVRIAELNLRIPCQFPRPVACCVWPKTAVLYHLVLKWGIDADAPDHDGRTPLHWAAYKGYADTLRLLLVLDARVALADKVRAGQSRDLWQQR